MKNTTNNEKVKHARSFSAPANCHSALAQKDCQFPCIVTSCKSRGNEAPRHISIVIRGTIHKPVFRPRQINSNGPATGKSTEIKECNADPIATNSVYSVFSPSKKWMIVMIASVAAFFSPFSANSYFPAIANIEKDLNITSQQVNLTVTVFMLFQAVSPSLWCSLADTRGRRPVYLATLSVYIMASIGVALVPNYALLLVFRMLQAFGASSVIAIGAGTIADISPPAERGGYLGWYSLGFNVGPLIGPALGGLLSHYFGWRSIFWTMAIVCGVHCLILGFCLPETLRSLVGNGSGYANPTPRQWWRHHQQQKQKIDDTGSFAIKTTVPPHENDKSRSGALSTINDICKLFFQPMLYAKELDVMLLLILYGFQYGACYAVTTSLPHLLGSVYFLNESAIGATYLANGLGCILGAFLEGRILNYNYLRMLRICDNSGMTLYSNDRLPIEHARLRTIWIHAVLFNILLVFYGWCLYLKTHLGVVLFIQFALGLTAQAVFNSVQTLLVDLYPEKSASITATNNMFRCLFGALATVSILPMINAVEVGWAFTIISIILLLSRMTIGLELHFGPICRLQRAMTSNLDEKSGFT
ncbi:major facilitator superfamily domain-containing protein [Dichotomocladium elegans]|nr:major facilitator superfamily domain-containing protein [Dichotomocladium elegans]